MSRHLLAQVRNILACESRFFLEASHLDLAVDEVERCLLIRQSSHSERCEVWARECALQAIQRANLFRRENERDGSSAHEYWAAYWTSMAVYSLALYVEAMPDPDEHARQRVNMAIHHARTAFQNWQVWIANQ